MAILRGKAFWTKMVKPEPKYDGTGDEWTMDVTVDEKSRKQLEELGIGHKIKPATRTNGKGETVEHASGMEYISFDRPTTSKSGDPINPIEIVDRHKEPWDPDVLIGNGSVVNVMFYVREGKMGGKNWAKPAITKLQVWDLEEVPDRDEFPSDEGSELEEDEEVWTTE